MGRHSFVVTGSTQLEVWEQLEEWLQDERDTWSAITPDNKKLAKKMMVRDEKNRRWVLAVTLLK